MCVSLCVCRYTVFNKSVDIRCFLIYHNNCPTFLLWFIILSRCCIVIAFLFTLFYYCIKIVVGPHVGKPLDSGQIHSVRQNTDAVGGPFVLNL